LRRDESEKRPRTLKRAAVESSLQFNGDRFASGLGMGSGRKRWWFLGGEFGSGKRERGNTPPMEKAK